MAKNKNKTRKKNTSEVIIVPESNWLKNNSVKAAAAKDIAPRKIDFSDMQEEHDNILETANKKLASQAKRIEDFKKNQLQESKKKR